MGGIDLHGAHPKEVEDDKIIAYNSRIGLTLFFIYLAFYLGFMGLSAFYPNSMSVITVGGLNLAIAYGFALILAAIVLALLYMVLCRKPTEEPKI